MRVFDVFLIAIGLAMDSFAVAMGVGTAGYGCYVRPALRLSFHFGLFQFLMPILGWCAGVWVEKQVKDYDHWVAFALLAGVGAHMIYESFRRDTTGAAADPTRGLRMLALSMATSIDALAVGMSLAMLGVAIWYPSVVFGVVTGVLSLLGVYLGNRLRALWGQRMELLGGVILISIGVRILVSHL